MTRITNNLLLAIALVALLAIAPLCAFAAPLDVVVTDATGKPLEGAVVTVTVPGSTKLAGPVATAQIAQQHREFVPQVTVVQTGTPVLFPNLDTVRHHVYSFSPIRAFELKLYAGTPSMPIVFDKPGTAVLGCNIHDRMTAWVVVVDTPYFAKTDGAGKAHLDVPAGEHLMRVWHGRQSEGVVPVERMVRAGGAAIGVKLAPFAEAS